MLLVRGFGVVNGIEIYVDVEEWKESENFVPLAVVASFPAQIPAFSYFPHHNVTDDILVREHHALRVSTAKGQHFLSLKRVLGTFSPRNASSPETIMNMKCCRPKV
jgi:hypothetical protein